MFMTVATLRRMDSKRCTKCQTEKSYPDFGRDKNRKDGLSPWCKACNTANAKRYYHANRDAVNARRSSDPSVRAAAAIEPWTMNPVCNSCGQGKPIESFAKRSDSPTGYRRICRDCYNAKSRANNDSEKNSERNKRRRREHPEKVAAAERRWKARNPEKVREMKRRSNQKNADAIREYGRKYREQNPEKVRDFLSRRRAKIKNNGVFRITDKDLRRLLSQPCFACGSTENQTLDHIIPIDRGGRHSVGNLMTLCSSCNSRKHTKLLIEWKVAA